MKKVVATTAALAAVLNGIPVQAASKVEVEMKRPPIAEWSLGETVVLGRPWGECADTVAEKIIQALSRRKLTAGQIDLHKVIYQRKTKLPTFLAAADVKALGKSVEADTLILLRTSKCTFPERTYKSGHPVNFLGIEDKNSLEFRTTTRTTVSATLQLLDLKGGRISKAIPLNASPEVTYKSKTGYPEEPSREAIREQAFDQIVTQVEILFFPWTETRELAFHDDKDCNLKPAYQAMKAGDVKAAVELSRKNNDECKTNPKAKEKHRVRATTNLATALVANNDFEAAVPLYEEALRLGGGDEQRAAIEWCQGQIEQQKSMAEVESKIAAQTLTPSY